MLGLLIKDIRLIKNQGLTFLVFAVVMGFALQASPENSSLFVLYFTVLASMWVMNTIAYDSYENGYAFLFTLPVSPGLYAAEKYVLALLFTSFTAVGALIFGSITVYFTRGNYAIQEHWYVCLMVWMFALCLACLMLPLNLKFGADKSRIVLIALWAGIVAAAYAFYRVDGEAVEGGLEAFNSLYKRLGAAGISLAGGIVTAAVFLLSMGISIRIMRKKEF